MTDYLEIKQRKLPTFFNIVRKKKVTHLNLKFYSFYIKMETSITD